MSCKEVKLENCRRYIIGRYFCARISLYESKVPPYEKNFQKYPFNFWVSARNIMGQIRCVTTRNPLKM